jgi:hypothetical protein
LEFFFIIIGIVLVIKNKLKYFYFFFFWTILSVLTLALSKEVPHATRGYFLVIPFVLFSAMGFLFIVQKIAHLKNSYVRNILFLSFAALCLYNIVYYFSSYYYRFPVLYAEGWRQQDKSLAKYLKENDQKYDKVIFDSNAGFIYTSLLFFTEYSPENFHETVKRLPDDSEGFSYVRSFGKYEWKEIDWDRDVKQPRTLIITSPDKIPSNQSATVTFSYPRKPVVLSVKETIAQYPVQDTAYVLVETR